MLEHMQKVARGFAPLVSAGLLAWGEAHSAMMRGAIARSATHTLDVDRAGDGVARLLKTAITDWEESRAAEIRKEIQPLLAARSKRDVCEAVAHAVNQRSRVRLPSHVVVAIVTQAAAQYVALLKVRRNAA